MKNLILKLLLLLLLVTGCRTKHLKVERSEEVVSHHKQLKKDSISEVKNEVRTYEFSSEVGTISEMEIISDKEKDSIIYERIRNPTSEKIIVRGGSLRLKTTQQTADKITKKDTLRVNNTSVRTSENTQKTTESKSFSKTKEVENKGFSFGFYFWIIIILVILFLIWRLKLFRLFSVILVKIKKCLNNI